MSPGPEHDRYVSTLDAAEASGLPEWWVSVLAERGDIPIRIIDGRRFVSLQAVEREARDERR